MGQDQYEGGHDELEEEEEDAVEKSPVFVIPALHTVSSLVESQNGKKRMRDYQNYFKRDFE